MNKHLQTMKNALTNYQKTVKAGLAKMEENNRLYKPEEAEKANAAIMAKLNDERQRVKDQIAEAQEAGQREVNAWGKLDGGKITDDAKLLEHGTITPAQFAALADRYQGNATMVDLLLKYANEHGDNGGGGFEAVWNFTGNGGRKKPHYDTSGLQTVEAKQAGINNAAASAFSLADRIGNLDDNRIGTGPESPFINSALEHFGENDVF